MLIVLLVACKTDKIAWNSAEVDGEAGFLITARYLMGSSFQCRPFRATTSPRKLGMFVPYSGKSPVVGFATGFQPTHIVKKWTWSGDVASVQFDPEIELPVRVFFLRGGGSEAAIAAMKTKADAAIARTQEIFDKERVGVRLKLLEDPIDKTAFDHDDFDTYSCAEVVSGAASGEPIRAEEERGECVNIWYVGKVQGGIHTGETCLVDAKHTILVGMTP